MAGIENSLKAISDLDALLCDFIAIAKTGVNIGNIGSLWKILGDIKNFGSDASNVMPELQSLDASEIAQLLGGSYLLVQDVLKALAK